MIDVNVAAQIPFVGGINMEELKISGIVKEYFLFDRSGYKNRLLESLIFTVVLVLIKSDTEFFLLSKTFVAVWLGYYLMVTNHCE